MKTVLEYLIPAFIAYLETERGYTITPPAPINPELPEDAPDQVANELERTMARFMSPESEVWEINEDDAYKAAWEQDRELFKEALSRVNWAQMVAGWSDETLAVFETGKKPHSNLGFTTPMGFGIAQAARKEYQQRYPISPRESNENATL